MLKKIKIASSDSNYFAYDAAFKDYGKLYILRDNLQSPDHEKFSFHTNIIVKDNYVIYAVDNKLKRKDLITHVDIVLFEVENIIQELMSVDQTLYFTSGIGEESVLHKANLNSDLVVDVCNNVIFLTTDTEYIYFIPDLGKGIYRYHMKSQHIEMISEKKVHSLFYNDGYLFYNNAHTASIEKLNLLTMEETLLAKCSHLMVEIFVKNEHVYFTCNGIFKLNLNDLKATKLVDHKGFRLFVDEKNLYYLKYHQDERELCCVDLESLTSEMISLPCT